MAHRDELKINARELDQTQRHAAALKRYRKLAAEAEGGAAGTLWVRIGSLESRADDRAAAATSYARAIDFFRAAGHRNNAIATARKLIELDPDSQAAGLNLLPLALELGYLELARGVVRELVRSTSGLDVNDDALGAIASFLEQSGNDRELSPEAISGILQEGGEVHAVSVLERLWRILTDRGAATAAGRIRSQIVELKPSADPDPASPLVYDGPARTSTPDSLAPLLDPTDEADQDIEIAPISGLEPTHADVAWSAPEADQADESEDEAAEDYGMLHLGGPDVAPASVPAADDLEAEDDSADLDVPEDDTPLPLLIPAERVGSVPPTETPPESPGPDRSESEWGRERDGEGEAPAIYLPDLDISAITRELEKVSTREVEASDAASHYDVGVAFKEMGMVEESIAQLTAALTAGYNPLATLEVLGEILVGQDDEALAANILRHVVSTETATDDDMVGVLYWLGRSEEALGNDAEAKRLLERVVRVAPAFRDASKRLRSG